MNQRGMVAALSFGVVTALTTLGTALLVRSLHEGRLGETNTNRQRAFYLAEAGLDRASINLRTVFDPADDVLAGTLPTGAFQLEDPPESLGGLRWRVRSTGTSGQIQRRVEAVFLLTPQSVFQFALFGDQRVDVSGNAYTDSYDSRVGPYDGNPLSPAYNAGHNGDVGTNATEPGGIEVEGSIYVDGQVAVGAGVADPLSVVEGYEPEFITGGTDPPSDTQDVVSQPHPFPMPDVVIPAGLLCLDETVTGNTTVALPPGTYCYRNLTVQGGAALTTDGTGPVTIYLSGTLVARGDSLIGDASDPRRMVIQIASSGQATIDDGTMTGTTRFYGALYGPRATIDISGDAQIYGSVIANRVNLTGSAVIHYDEALTDLSGVSNVYQRTVLSWREVN